MVTVRAGDIEITANNQSFPVHSGQTAYFDNSGNPLTPGCKPTGRFRFLRLLRDRLEDVPPPQYVSPDMVGMKI